MQSEVVTQFLPDPATIEEATMPSKQFLRRIPHATTVITVLFASFLLTACATAFNSPDFEKDAFAANTELNKFLVDSKSKTANIPYKDVIADYNKIEVLMDNMVLRTRLVDNNDKTLEIAEQIRGNFRDMRATHKGEVAATPTFFAGKQMTYETLFYSLLVSEKSKPTSK